MAYTKYSEKLQNPLWQKKRLEVLNRDHFTCQLCGDKETTLHIHHKEYRKGCEPWEYELENFQTLCKHCHTVVEYFKLKGHDILFCRKISYESDYHSFYATTIDVSFSSDSEKTFNRFLMQGDVIEMLRSFSEFDLNVFNAMLGYTK